MVSNEPYVSTLNDEINLGISIPTSHPVGQDQVEQDENPGVNPDTPIKSRSNSSSSEYTSSEYSSSASSNGSIENEEESYITSLYVNDNPTDSNTKTILVERSRVEFLEFLNENISSIIEEAIKNGVTVT